MSGPGQVAVTCPEGRYGAQQYNIELNEMIEEYRSRELVEVFFDSVVEAFSFLAQDDEWTMRTGLRAWDQNDLRTIRLEELPQNSFFWASADFTRGSCTVRVTYGDRECDIETIIEFRPFANEPRAFALWEWLAALGVASDEHAVGTWVFQPARIRKTVAGMGSLLRNHRNSILQPEAQTLERLEVLRAERVAAWQAQERENDLRRAAARAAEAFHVRNYNAVVDALLPFESMLTPAQRVKLAYARKHATRGREIPKE